MVVAEPKEKSQDEREKTRQRILEAAGEVFAERGYERATIREIVKRARVNVAAVNYYFRDKSELYMGLFKDGGCLAANHWKLAEMIRELGAKATPKEKLAAFIRGFLLHLLYPGMPSWRGKVMAREMFEPTPALDVVVKEMIEPTFGILRKILAEVFGVPPESELVRHVGASVIGQCLFYKHSEAVIKRLYPDVEYSADAIEEIAKQVTRFTLYGVEGLDKIEKQLELGRAEGRKMHESEARFEKWEGS